MRVSTILIPTLFDNGNSLLSHQRMNCQKGDCQINLNKYFTLLIIVQLQLYTKHMSKIVSIAEMYTHYHKQLFKNI